MHTTRGIAHQLRTVGNLEFEFAQVTQVCFVCWFVGGGGRLGGLKGWGFYGCGELTTTENCWIVVDLSCCGVSLLFFFGCECECFLYKNGCRFLNMNVVFHVWFCLFVCVMIKLYICLRRPSHCVALPLSLTRDAKRAARTLDVPLQEAR